MTDEGLRADFDKNFVLAIRKVLDAVVPQWITVSHRSLPGDAIAAIRKMAEERDACRAQQRENAETIKALKERVATAEAANTELDNARKSAEQSARDLRENNATLRAEVRDAIKGAQRGVKFIAHNDIECTARFADGKYNITWQHGELGPMTLDAMYKTWPHLKAEERAALEALRHPAPALPVVGACVKTSHYTLTWLADKSQNQQECERLALNEVAEYGGVACRLYRDVTPLPTEGGK